MNTAHPLSPAFVGSRFAPLVALALPAVLAAAPNEAAPPNDPLFDRQVSFESPGRGVEIDISSGHPSARRFDCGQGLDVNALKAWSVTTGSREVVVAVLDDGFFYDHEDLRANIWANPGETGPDERGYARETNGVDDDSNGFVDDVIGWDFAFDDPDPDAYIFDGMLNTRIQPYWHSMCALGIIGAEGNNGVGVAGLNWEVSMMLLKIGMQGTWPREVEDRAGKAALAIRYAADNGAHVINWSGWVADATPEDQAVMKAAIDYAASKGVLLVLAAGNDGRNLDLDESARFPQSLDCDNIINVAEIDFDGTLDTVSGLHGVSSSCWGLEHVWIAALGKNYAPDVQDGRSIYRLSGGTSCAAPVVTGVVALMLSVNPRLNYRQIKEILLETAHPLPVLEGKVASGGMVDAHAAVREAERRAGVLPGLERAP